MLKGLIVGSVAIVFMASSAVAMGGCAGKSHTAQAGQSSQTVVTEDGKQSTGSVTKDDKS